MEKKKNPKNSVGRPAVLVSERVKFRVKNPNRMKYDI